MKQLSRAERVISIFWLCTTLFVLIALTYYSEFKYDGENREKFYLLYSVFLSMLSLQVLFYFRFQRLNVYLLVTLITTFSFLLFLELYLSAYGDGIFENFSQREQIRTVKSLLKYDERTQQEVVHQQRQSGMDALPNYIPNLFAGSIDPANPLVPLSGARDVLTVDCNESGTWAIFKSDRYGFNNNDAIWDQSQNFDFVLFGDSFAQGQCVDQDDTIAAALNRKHRIRGVSFGKAGNGPLINLATMVEYGLLGKAKTVIWLYFEGNDTFDVATEKLNPILRSYIDDQRQRGNLNAVDKLDRTIRTRIASSEFSSKQTTISLAGVLTLSQVRRLFHSLYYRMVLEYENYSQQDFSLHLKIIETAHKLATDRGQVFLFVIVPDINRFINPNHDADRYRGKGQLKHHLRRLGIESLDIFSEINALRVDYRTLYPPAPFYGHFNPAGYQFVADLIAKKMRGRNDSSVSSGIAGAYRHDPVVIDE